MIIESAVVHESERFDVDVCIVGAGPAGLAIARRLRGSGLKVVLLESGGLTSSVAGQNLNRGDVTGHPYWPLHSTRVRALGGTGNRWAGWCRPLDEIDFEHRDWVADSGWPIGYAEVERFHEDAARFLQLPDLAFEDPSERLQGTQWPAASAAGLDPVLYRFSPLTRLGQTYVAELQASTETTVILHATVTDLRLDPGTSRVGTVRVRGAGSRTFEVAPAQVVLAAGGIENPRLLLTARTDREAGLGNEHDAVGRYFMEHLHVEAGVILDADAAVRTPFFDWSTSLAAGRGALSGSADVQHREHLLAISFTVTPSRRHFGQRRMRMPPALDIPSQRVLEHLPLAVRRIGWAAKRAGRRLFHPAPGLPRGVPAQLGRSTRETRDVRFVHARGEQVPHRDSRISLGKGRDHHGQPVAQLDWRLSEQDFANVESWVSRLRAAVAATGASGLLPAAALRSSVIGGPHHLGTTRMSADPRRGVVDAHCRVHSVDNLYVAGSSVFPTGGYANPTFSLVALAIRLADHLKDHGRSSVRVAGLDTAQRGEAG